MKSIGSHSASAARFVIAALALGISTVAVASPSLPPNELGQFMVLEYHQIGPGEGRWRREPQALRQDLQDLYDRGYVLAKLNDLLDGKILAPAGKTPVVLTFDDAAVGQFGKLSDGSWDPNTAVGVIDGFYQKHPDFGRAATFYLNPDKKSSRAWSGMLTEMVAMGFELGNHTVTHAYLNRLSQSAVEAEIAGCQEWIQMNVEGYKVRTLALPFGLYPREGTERREAWAQHGDHKGVRYDYDALLEVGSGSSVSPLSSKFKNLHIPRIQVCAATAECLQPGAPVFSNILKYFDRTPSARLVSDGDPDTVTVPGARVQELDAHRTRGLRVIER